MITNFGDLLNPSNLGWMFFLLVCTIPGLLGLVFAFTSLCDTRQTKTH